MNDCLFYTSIWSILKIQCGFIYVYIYYIEHEGNFNYQITQTGALENWTDNSKQIETFYPFICSYLYEYIVHKVREIQQVCFNFELS